VTRSAPVLTLAAMLAATSAGAQPGAELLVSVRDTAGSPVTGLTAEAVSLERDGVPVPIVSLTPLPPTVQVVAVFEGLAVTQRQLNSALARFIGVLDAESVVDMQSVDGPLDAAILQAISDLHDRDAPQPVVVMLGQASEIGRSDLQSSQVRGRRQAADLSGDVEGIRQALAAHGIPLYGVSVTDRALDNLTELANHSGGRFEIIDSPDRLADTLDGIGLELGARYLIRYDASILNPPPVVRIDRPDTRVSAVPYRPTHER